MLHRFDLQVELDIQTWTSALDLEHAQCTEASSLFIFRTVFSLAGCCSRRLTNRKVKIPVHAMPYRY